MQFSERHRLSRDLDVVLRHSAPLYGLAVRDDGFVSVAKLLALDEFCHVMLEDLQDLASYYPKKLDLVNEVKGGQTEWFIRSKGGHTVQTVWLGGLELMGAAEVKAETIVYCTTVTNLKRIRRACAVHSDERCKYITFERREPTVNRRCVLLFLDIAKALRARLQFYKTWKNTIACPGNSKGVIPLSYFSKIETRDGMDKRSDPMSLTPSTTTSETSSGYSLAEGPVEVLFSRYPSPPAQRQAQLGPRIHGSGDFSRPEFPSMSMAGHMLDDSPADSNSDGAEDIHIIVATQSIPTFTRSTSLSPDAPEFVPSGNASRWVKTVSPVCRDPLLSTLVSAPLHHAPRADKWLIMPVSIPGCGKTGICAALSYLFGFAHVRPVDDTLYNHAENAHRGAGGKTQRFLDDVSSALESNGVVLADRNNHLRQHRQRLRTASSRTGAGVADLDRAKIVALRWCPGPRSMQAVHACCTERILSWRLGQQWFSPRPGDTLKRVLWKFLREVQLEPLLPEDADEIIEMDPLDDAETALKVAVQGLHDVMGLKLPSPEIIAHAVRAARASAK